MTLDQEIRELSASPTSSEWLRKAIQQLYDRDCVDAANDAETLADLFNRRCKEILGSPRA